ncbi:glycoside hydrolase family 25 protein [Pedobacter sp. LMG 31464]|uniref:Glycoside hydrolase family 25 protein n=1 Tax=Pedobacter planticolens TaxID=2679964 RepID=A0A923DZK1_9SPHI|nr:glycoside hydrolase family 25 protein [Pedobacter planticolens]MBB2145338.1 glycoside hydrolase family 25 protein [Pedobacter planticolens]
MPVKKRKPSRKKSKGLSLQLKFAIAGILLVLLSPFYYGYVVKIATSTWFWLRHPGEDKNYRTYESFNIKIPKKYTVHGIDVSYYQGKIDWQKVKAMKEDDVHVTFAFIKATEGILNVDPYFQRNWREAPKAGVKVGAYHFFRPKRSGLWQANFFLQTANFEKGDLPPVVDIESLDGVSPEKMRKELNAFIIQIEEKTKVKPIIYSGLKFYQDNLMGFYDDYPFWVAHYHQPKLKLPTNTWKFWQHSDKASINGINHIVDFNAFNGDSLAFTKILIQ